MLIVARDVVAGADFVSVAEVWRVEAARVVDGAVVFVDELVAREDVVVVVDFVAASVWRVEGARIVDGAVEPVEDDFVVLDEPVVTRDDVEATPAARVSGVEREPLST